MGIGLVLSYCATAFVIYTAVNGVGISGKNLPALELQRLQFGSWMIQKFWAPSMAFVKTSIIVFLQRILGTLPTFRVISNWLIVFITLWAVAALLVNIFQCNPVQFYYDKSLHGHCMKGQTVFFITMGSIALVEDVVILALPVPVIWGLQIAVRQKIAVTLVFSLGGLVCIFSLMRLIEFRNFILTDLASSSAKESIWTILELDVAIICGCLPIMKPLIQGLLGKVKSSASRGRSHPSSATKLYFQSTTPQSDGFLKMADGIEGSKTTEVRAGSSQGSEIELQGIAVHTVIEQDVEQQPQITTTQGWP
ncbi:hypothetical protein P175DRAFT_0500166 [Aspergillus ochraceoroseus IBT 24754]|nr:uncharacterized protein P175DRAFT_0500166 [Aspergillus ochraceoroseus IBT 24754]PTU23602.1 hypothetical protein P175DRAFT_0500166 [Aspergillus ochraceoroseus IBT 24754]